MAISAVNSVDNNGKYTPTIASEMVENNQPQIQLEPEKIIIAAKQESESDKREVEPIEARKLSKEMNKFMRMLNSTIRFVLHEKTNTFIVQVIDSKDNTVLKEFPPHELLDTKAKIREYVGILLDRHA